MAASTSDASSFITGLAQQTLSTISNKSLSKPQKQAKLQTLFSANVDIPWVGRFVLGQYWRQASDAQKQRYLSEYQKFLIQHYTDRFTDYTSGKFKVTGSRADDDNEFVVSMTIQSNDADSEPVNVDYKVRAENGGFKIFDVVVEGVSMITTQRSEFGSVLSQHDIGYLTDQLAAKAIVIPDK